MVEIYKPILDSTGVCLTAYQILYVLYSAEMDYGLYRFNEGGKEEFPGLQNHQIAEKIQINKSTVTRHLRKLKRYVIKKEKKYYRVSTSVKRDFSNLTITAIYFRLDKCLYKFFKTPEQCVLIRFLWDEYYCKKKEIDKKEIYSALPMSTKHINNNLKNFEMNELITIDSGMIDFNMDLKRVLHQII